MEVLKKVEQNVEYRERQEAEKVINKVLPKLEAMYRAFKNHKEKITPEHIKKCAAAMAYMNLCIKSFSEIPNTIKITYEIWVDEDENTAKQEVKADE